MSDYLQVVYSSETRPPSDYPFQLAEYLAERLQIQAGSRLLELGPGRGEVLSGFRRLGIDCFGADASQYAGSLCPGIPIAVVDLDATGLPFEDDSFDVIFSKSLFEHLQDPLATMREAIRVLKPGGEVICMVPDWESNYKIYFDDFTHRTPFTRFALSDLLKIAGFEHTNVEKFRQLPIVWRSRTAKVVSRTVGLFAPRRSRIKFVRWSRELMLLGTGRKPDGS